jgi:hypothetical protein
VKSCADAITTAVAELGRTVSSVTVSNADAAPHTVLWGRVGVAYPASVGRMDGTRLGPRELGGIKERQLLQVLPLEQGHTVAKSPATDPRLAAHGSTSIGEACPSVAPPVGGELSAALDVAESPARCSTRTLCGTQTPATPADGGARSGLPGGIGAGQRTPADAVNVRTESPER